MQRTTEKREDNRKKEKKNGVFLCGHEGSVGGSRRGKRRERVSARRADVGEKARGGEILDTPKPVVASPSINSTGGGRLTVKAELSTRGSVPLKGMRVSVNHRPARREI